MSRIRFLFSVLLTLLGLLTLTAGLVLASIAFPPIALIAGGALLAHIGGQRINVAPPPDDLGDR